MSGVSRIQYKIVPAKELGPSTNVSINQSMKPLFNEQKYIKDPKEYVRHSLQLGLKAGMTTDGPLPYCDQVLTAESDGQINQLISNLHYYELRARERAPIGAKAKRRLVSGAREALRHAQLGHIRLLIVAIDVEEKVRLSKDWKMLFQTARIMSIPLVYGLSRAEMTASLGRRGCSTSLVGVLNADGAYQIYQELATFAIEAHTRWVEMATELVLTDMKNNSADSLYVISYYGHRSVLEAIVEMDSLLFNTMINFVSSQNGYTPLFFACVGGQPGTVSFLLEKKALPLLTDFSLRTALHYCALVGCEESFKLILDAINSDSNLSDALKSRDCTGRNVLSCALVSMTEGIIYQLLPTLISLSPELLNINLLIQLIKNPKSTSKIFAMFLKSLPSISDCELSLIVHSISKVGSLDYLRALFTWMQRNSKSITAAIIDDTSIDGRTPTWWAAYLGHVGLARELLSHGTNPSFTFTIDSQIIPVSTLLDKWKMAARTQ